MLRQQNQASFAKLFCYFAIVLLVQILRLTPG